MNPSNRSWVLINIAPWQDYEGKFIQAGDTIRHPDGDEGVVVLTDDIDAGDRWRVDYGNGPLSRLCLQIGPKGQAVVVKRGDQ